MAEMDISAVSANPAINLEVEISPVINTIPTVTPEIDMPVNEAPVDAAVVQTDSLIDPCITVNDETKENNVSAVEGESNMDTDLSESNALVPQEEEKEKGLKGILKHKHIYGLDKKHVDFDMDVQLIPYKKEHTIEIQFVKELTPKIVSYRELFKKLKEEEDKAKEKTMQEDDDEEEEIKPFGTHILKEPPLHHSLNPTSIDDPKMIKSITAQNEKNANLPANICPQDYFQAKESNDSNRKPVEKPKFSVTPVKEFLEYRTSIISDVQINHCQIVNDSSDSIPNKALVYSDENGNIPKINSDDLINNNKENVLSSNPTCLEASLGNDDLKNSSISDPLEFKELIVTNNPELIPSSSGVSEKLFTETTSLNEDLQLDSCHDYFYFDDSSSDVGDSNLSDCNLNKLSTNYVEETKSEGVAESSPAIVNEEPPFEESSNKDDDGSRRSSIDASQVNDKTDEEVFDSNSLILENGYSFENSKTDDNTESSSSILQLVSQSSIEDTVSSLPVDSLPVCIRIDEAPQSEDESVDILENGFSFGTNSEIEIHPEHSQRFLYVPLQDEISEEDECSQLSELSELKDLPDVKTKPIHIEHIDIRYTHVGHSPEKHHKVTLESIREEKLSAPSTDRPEQDISLHQRNSNRVELALEDAANSEEALLSSIKSIDPSCCKLPATNNYQQLQNNQTELKREIEITEFKRDRCKTESVSYDESIIKYNDRESLSSKNRDAEIQTDITIPKDIGATCICSHFIRNQQNPNIHSVAVDNILNVTTRNDPSEDLAASPTTQSQQDTVTDSSEGNFKDFTQSTNLECSSSADSFEMDDNSLRIDLNNVCQSADVSLVEEIPQDP